MAAVTPRRMVGTRLRRRRPRRGRSPAPAAAPPAATRGAPISAWVGRDLEVGEDGTALLGHADHVEGGDALALEMGRHAEQGRDR